MKYTLFLVISFVFSIQLNATTYTVTTTNDSGIGSLREAVSLCNGIDTINFDPSLLAFGSDTIFLDSSILLSFGDVLTINGLMTNQDTLFISGQGVTRIFEIDGGIWWVNFNSVALIDGFATNGGAIMGGGDLYFSNSIIRNCRASGKGGVIYNYDSYGTANFSNCTISNNSAGADGGVLYYDVNTSGDVKFINCTLSYNSAANGGVVGAYDDIFCSTLRLEITNSTLDHNYASSKGGVVYAFLECPDDPNPNFHLDISKSTLVFNSAGFAGSVIYTHGYQITDDWTGNYSVSFLLIKKSTITDNSGPSTIYFYDEGKYVGISSSIVTSPSGFPITPVGYISQGYNVFSDFQGTLLASDQNGATSASLNLGPLQNNGGTTLTMMPNVGSIAINAGQLNDFSAAQNGAILQRRDAGACESYVCLPIVVDYGTRTICPGNSFDLHGQLLTTSGLYSQLISDTLGCDSTFTVNLIVEAIADTLDVAICQGETYTFDGIAYSTAGIYTANYLSTNGCDSIVTLNLTITNSTTGSETVTACETYTWLTNGNTYTTSGTYFSTLSNANGCDSIVTLNLTINHSTTGSETVTACETYTWLTNGNIYTSSGTYFSTLSNVNGCDSIVTLNLTINNSTTGSETLTACETYTWLTNGNTYTSSGTYFSTLSNANGCDSTITLNLTITFNPIALATIQADTLIQASPANMNYQWIDCLTNTIIPAMTSEIIEPSTGVYAVIVTNSSACSDTSSCISFTNTSGIIENNLELLKIHPNPTSGKLILELTTKQQGDNHIQIYNSLGTLVYEKKMTQFIEEINLEHFASGIYHLEFKNAENSSFFKFVKE